MLIDDILLGAGRGVRSRATMTRDVPLNYSVLLRVYRGRLRFVECSHLQGVLVQLVYYGQSFRVNVAPTSRCHKLLEGLSSFGCGNGSDILSMHLFITCTHLPLVSTVLLFVSIFQANLTMSPLNRLLTVDPVLELL